MPNISGLLFGVALGAIATVSLTQTSWPVVSAHAAASDTYKQLNLLGEVFERINTNYVERPDDRKLVEAAINGMLTSLDPHSSYMDAKGFQEFTETQTKGEFGGLGVVLTMDDHVLKIVSLVDDSPASKAGVQAGDVITALDGTSTEGMTITQAADKMRGAINSAITLKIQRDKKSPFDIKVVRDIVKLKSVASKLMGDVGYISITGFTGQTYDGLKKELDSLNSQIGKDKLKGYVIDLRNNPGGLVDQSVKVCDAFLHRGEIVSVRGRDADDIQRYSAHNGDLTGGKPLIVLINGGSASAAEIVAGALQDQKRATILGTRSFGKGSVQTIIPLDAEGALRLTTARYYTPSGRSIQAKGIEPDIVVQENVPADMQGADQTKGEAGLSNHLANPGQDKTEEGGSSDYVPLDGKDDTQLNTALDLLRGAQKSAAFPPNPRAGGPG
ncbi:S41 family peptidase [Labrys neptuniae]